MQNSPITEDNQTAEKIKVGSLVRLARNWHMPTSYMHIAKSLEDNDSRIKNFILDVTKADKKKKSEEYKAVAIYYKDMMKLMEAERFEDSLEKTFVVVEGPAPFFDTTYVSLKTHILFSADPERYPNSCVAYYRVLIKSTGIWLRNDAIIAVE